MTLPPALHRLRLPVIGAPIFVVSNPGRVIAQCKAGIAGSFPACNAPAAALEEWLARITGELAEADAPFAVHHAVHHGNPSLAADVEICVKYRVPIVTTALEARPELARAIHSYGGLVLHSAVDAASARTAIAAGADGLILHPGARPAFALMREIGSWFDGPIALAGVEPHGAAILAAQAMGADLAQIDAPADFAGLEGEYRAARTRLLA